MRNYGSVMVLMMAHSWFGILTNTVVVLGPTPIILPQGQMERAFEANNGLNGTEALEKRWYRGRYSDGERHL